MDGLKKLEQFERAKIDTDIIEVNVYDNVCQFVPPEKYDMLLNEGHHFYLEFDDEHYFISYHERNNISDGERNWWHI